MNIYRENILDHYQNPRNYGRLNQPTVSINESNPLCGDQLHFELEIKKGVISDIKFEGGGCAISMAAASMLTEKVNGESVTTITDLSDQDMLDELGVPLSPTRTKCGLLALSGVRKALVDTKF